MTAPASSNDDLWSKPLVTGCAFLLTLITALVGLQLQQDRIAVFWPAAGVIVGLVIVFHDRRRWAALLGSFGALCIGNALQRRGLATSLVFMAGNLGQALLIGVLLECLAGTPVRFVSLRRVGAFFLVTGMAAALTGVLTAVGLKATGHASGTFAGVDRWPRAY